MSEASTSTTQQPTAPAAEASTPAQPEAYVPPASQADLDRIIESRLARERAKYDGFDDLKAKAAKYDETVEASKTELQKATDRAAKAEQDLQEERLGRLRLEAAAQAGLPVEMAGRLQGSNDQELKADAAKLSTLLAAPAVGGNRADQGKLPAGGASNDWLRDNLTRAR